MAREKRMRKAKAEGRQTTSAMARVRRRSKAMANEAPRWKDKLRNALHSRRRAMLLGNGPTRSEIARRQAIAGEAQH